MKKKLLLFIFLIICTVACIISFVACKTTGNENSSENQEITQPPADKDNEDNVDNNHQTPQPPEVIKKDLISFSTLEVDGETVYGKVPNATVDFSFIKEVTANGDSTYIVATDKACKNVIPSKTVDLKVGDNLFYILADNGNDIKLFTVTLRRRPFHTVTFNSNGGTGVETQFVEEDEFAQVPQTTRTGYTFAQWNYDFSQPITKSETITAVWTANKYAVNLDVNGGEYLAENTQQVTYDQEFNLPTVSKTGYTFLGWYDDGVEITDGVWQFTDNKNLCAKWEINHYSYSVNSNLSQGGTLNCTTSDVYEYNTDIALSCTVNSGYNFLGWYKENELISLELEYNFKIVSNMNIIAKFKVYDELEIFNFHFNENGVCIIDSLINSRTEEMTIPKYAQLSSLSMLTSLRYLKSIQVENGNPYYSSYEGILYNKAFSEIIYCPVNIENIIIHSKLSELKDKQFANLKNLKYVEFNDKIRIIDCYAFNGCSALETVKLSNATRTIYVNAFSGCGNLKNIESPFEKGDVNIENDKVTYGTLFENRPNVFFTAGNIREYNEYNKQNNYNVSTKGWYFSL